MRTNLHTLHIDRQRTLSRVAILLSDVDNFRGRSHEIVEMIAPYAEASGIFVYRLEYEPLRYQLVSSWIDDSQQLNYNSNFCQSIPVECISDDLSIHLLRGAVQTHRSLARRGLLFPVVQQLKPRSTIIYPVVTETTIQAFAIFMSHNPRGWNETSRQWLETIVAMAASSIKRTVANEILRRELAWRDKVYPIIAHDLRGSIGTLQMLSQGGLMAQSEIEMREVMEMIARGAEQSFILLDNLLKWSRANVGNSTMAQKESVDMAQLIFTVEQWARPIAQAKGVELVVEISTEDQVMEADVEMTRTIIRNLLSNAIKFTPSSGCVTLSYDHCKIWVQDTGRGLSADQIKMLLHGSVHFTTYGTAGEKGSGLGFSLVREFIRAQGWKLSIYSQIGQGSVFEILCG